MATFSDLPFELTTQIFQSVIHAKRSLLRLLKLRLLNHQWNSIILHHILTGSPARRDAATILSTRPFFIRYLHSIFDDESNIKTETALTIARHISDAITVVESFRDDDVSSQEIELQRKQYKDLLLESVADTITIEMMISPSPRSKNPGFSYQAKLYGGLILASMIGDTKTIKTILGQVSTPSMYHYYFGTALAAGARGNQHAAVELLLQLGAQLTVPRCYGKQECPRLNRLPLTIACLKGYKDIVRLLLEYSNNLHDISEKVVRYDARHKRPRRTEHFNAAVDAAFRGRHLSIVHFLLGSDIIPSSDAEHAVFYLAAEHGSVEVINSIMTSGFDITGEEYFIQTRNFPLEGAARKNRVATLKRLLELGLAKGPRGYGMVLHIAATRGNLEVTKTLFDEAPQLFTPGKYNTHCHAPKSPLQLSLRHQQEEMLEYLLSLSREKGLAELSPRVLSGLSHEGKIESIRVVLEAGGDPNSYPPRFRGYTALPPLVAAMKRGNQELVDLFLRFGAKSGER